MDRMGSESHGFRTAHGGSEEGSIPTATFGDGAQSHNGPHSGSTSTNYKTYHHSSTAPLGNADTTAPNSFGTPHGGTYPHTLVSGRSTATSQLPPTVHNYGAPKQGTTVSSSPPPDVPAYSNQVHGSKHGLTVPEVEENVTPIKIFFALMFAIVSIVSLVVLIRKGDMKALAYIVTFFNIFVGFVLIVVEGPASWTWGGFRTQLFTFFPFLAFRLGRSIFYLYLSIILFGLAISYAAWYFYVLGALLFVCSMLQLYVRFCNALNVPDV